MTLHPPIPVLRIFDAGLARRFYVDWLGFQVDWEVRTGYGDCSPGAKVFINTDDVDALHGELATRPNPNMRPGVELAPWNARVMDVIDPFGNRLSFNQPLPRP